MILGRVLIAQFGCIAVNQHSILRLTPIPAPIPVVSPITSGDIAKSEAKLRYCSQYQGNPPIVRTIVKLTILGIAIAIFTVLNSTVLNILWGANTIALPPPEDIPEEILRTGIITEGRSPIDGKLLTASEYAQLTVKLQQRAFPPKLSPKVRETVFLLRLRSLVKQFFPFIDI